LYVTVLIISTGSSITYARRSQKLASPTKVNADVGKIKGALHNALPKLMLFQADLCMAWASMWAVTREGQAQLFASVRRTSPPLPFRYA